MRSCGRLAADDSEPDRRQAVKADAVAPPLRGFGLDGLTPSRFGLSKQTKADWKHGRASNPEQRGSGAYGVEIIVISVFADHKIAVYQLLDRLLGCRPGRIDIRA